MRPSSLRSIFFPYTTLFRSITDEFSKGCLRLIQQNRAQLLFDIEPFLSDLGWKRSEKTRSKDNVQISVNLESFSETEQKIMKCLQKGILHIDDLAFETQMDMAVLNAELMMLENRKSTRLNSSHVRISY